MKYLLTIAINQYHTAPLRGCINDSVNLANFLSAQGFEIHSLHDQQATRQGILNKVAELGSKLKPNDYLVVHYSGHGSQIPCTKGDEADGLTEIICPIDLINPDGSWTNNYITDDNISDLLTKLDETISVEFFMDCCHSGTLTRDLKPFAPRQLDYPVRSGITHTSIPFKPVFANVITWSGCQDNQTSADAFINNDFQGAFTYALLKHAGLGKTRQETFQLMTSWLADNGYSQKPNISVQNLKNREFGLNTAMWSLVEPVNLTAKSIDNSTVKKTGLVKTILNMFGS